MLRHLLSYLTISYLLLGSPLTLAQQKINIDDQKVIIDSILCQNIPAIDRDEISNFGISGAPYFYAYHFEKTKNLFSKNAQSTTEKFIDHSPYTFYEFKEPIVIGNIAFSQFYTADVEDGELIFSAIKPLDSRDDQYISKLPKNAGFFVAKYKGNLILSCSYYMNDRD